MAKTNYDDMPLDKLHALRVEKCNEKDKLREEIMAIKAVINAKTAKDRAADHAAVAGLVAELGAERVVVGLPLSVDGSMGPAARAAATEAEALGDFLGVPVETYDERLTTVTADRSLSSLGLPGQARRRVVDKVAAAVMLQAWLDRSSS